MAALHVGPAFNPEEAAHAAAEFVASMSLAPPQMLACDIRDQNIEHLMHSQQHVVEVAE